jgi:prolyl-tRNA synthetase
MSNKTQSQPGKTQSAISPTREENYPEWYQQVIRAADLAEPSPVRGCMVIKPWGYALWENIQKTLDEMFKNTGHRNAYFPLFIPLSFLEKEAQHVEGFAKECAVVTHHRLIEGPEGGLIPDPDSRLEEPLVVRPTSETIIGAMFAKWIQSHRDLPLLINQWANVVRWEMRTRLFLRTAEFLWQEGHTAHATAEEAMEETRRMLDVYADFAENEMAMPVIKGEKTESERFPGAVNTYTIEAMMQDRKALQAGTSHFLGQNFSKAQEIKFASESGELQFAWTTSWGVSTRLIGALLMTHSDDDGLIVPPRIAPAHIAIMPVLHKAEGGGVDAVMNYCRKLSDDLRVLPYHGRRLQIEIDDRDMRGGDKVWSWIKKGVPIRLEVGPRDMAADSVFMGRRDKPHKEKQSVGRAEFISTVLSILDEIQDTLLERAQQFRAEHTRRIDSKDEFYDFFSPPPTAPGKEQGETAPIHGGFALTHFSGDREMEDTIKSDLNVTIRCIPLAPPGGDNESGTCPFTGGESPRRVVWAKAY